MKFILRIIAIGCFVAAVVSIKISLFMIDTLGPLVLLFWGFGIVSSILGAYIYKESKNINLTKEISHKKTLTQLDIDEREPILYLRSFVSDSLAGKSENDDLLAKFLSLGYPQNLNSEEEQLSYAIKKYGPFIAIGNPNDSLPQIGASRIYTENDKWKDVVTDLIKTSQLIILRLGVTPSFWWEVDVVFKNKKPEKIIFLLPESSDKYYEFKEEFEKRFSQKLPSHYNPGLIGGQSFSAILVYNQNWEPRILYCIDKTSMSFRNTVKEEFDTILRYVFNRYNEGWNFKGFEEERAKPRRTLMATIQLIGGILIFSFIITAIIAAIVGGMELGSQSMIITWLSISLIWCLLILLGEKLE